MSQTITELLTALGDTADEIAASLTAQGFRGVRQSPTLCPLAVYLSECGAAAPEVCAEQIGAYEEAGEWVDVKPTAAMRRFVIEFDNGEYPDLEAN